MTTTTRFWVYGRTLADDLISPVGDAHGTWEEAIPYADALREDGYEVLLVREETRPGCRTVIYAGHHRLPLSGRIAASDARCG